MTMKHKVVALGAGLVGAVALGIGTASCDNNHTTHKALCWQPSYASTHTLHNAKTFANLGHDLPLGSRHCKS